MVQRDDLLLSWGWIADLISPPHVLAQMAKLALKNMEAKFQSGATESAFIVASATPPKMDFPSSGPNASSETRPPPWTSAYQVAKASTEPGWKINMVAPLCQHHVKTVFFLYTVYLLIPVFLCHWEVILTVLCKVDLYKCCFCYFHVQTVKSSRALASQRANLTLLCVYVTNKVCSMLIL